MVHSPADKAGTADARGQAEVRWFPLSITIRVLRTVLSIDFPTIKKKDVYYVDAVLSQTGTLQYPKLWPAKPCMSLCARLDPGADRSNILLKTADDGY